MLLFNSFLCEMQWLCMFPLRTHHAPLRRWAHLPKVPAQHLWPLPLPRLPAPEAPARWCRGERRGSTTAEIHSRDWDWAQNCDLHWNWHWDWIRQRSVVNTDHIPDRGKRHQQQGKEEERVRKEEGGRWTEQLGNRVEMRTRAEYVLSDGISWTWRKTERWEY